MSNNEDRPEAADMLLEMLESTPEIDVIDLTDQEINDLEPLVAVIAQFPNLEELCLSNNLFTEMPADLSSWELVANLNISNVQFDDFEQCVHGLATMPALKSLYVNLHEETQVDLIMKLLPSLEFLNGLPVDREALDEEAEETVEEDPPKQYS